MSDRDEPYIENIENQETFSDSITQEQEAEDVQAVQQYIEDNSPVSIGDITSAKPGPTTDKELATAGLSRTQQVYRIVNGLDYCGCVDYITDAYIEWVGH